MGFFERLGRFVARRRGWVVAVWALLALIARPLAPQAPGALQPGGFTSDDLEAARARALLDSRIDLPMSALVIVIESTTDARAAQLAALRFRQLRAPRTPDGPATAPDVTAPRRDLLFFNGIGGFAPDGREYVIRLGPGQTTPAPWVNVLSNQHFGSVISEAGAAYTWSENAHQFRLTPWDNDPVSDAGGEAFYLRDEETGQFWSPAPLPCRGAGDQNLSLIHISEPKRPY